MFSKDSPLAAVISRIPVVSSISKRLIHGFLAGVRAQVGPIKFPQSKEDCKAVVRDGPLSSVNPAFGPDISSEIFLCYLACTPHVYP